MLLMTVFFLSLTFLMLILLLLIFLFQQVKRQGMGS